MKSYGMVLVLAAMLVACGGSGGESGSGRGSEDVLVGPDNAPINSGSTLGDIAATVTLAIPSAADNTGSDKRAAPATDSRFDEHGNIKGVYGVPYVPSKKNQGNP